MKHTLSVVTVVSNAASSATAAKRVSGTNTGGSSFTSVMRTVTEVVDAAAQMEKDPYIILIHSYSHVYIGREVVHGCIKLTIRC